jgi:tetratricopeptide (TPR) repeat protein
MFLGQLEEGISHIEKSIRLNPRDRNIGRPNAILGIGHFLLGRVDRSIDLLRQARAANPRFWGLHLVLLGASGFKGDLDEARSALAEPMKLKPEVNSLMQWHAHTPWATNPRHMTLGEPTLYAGLRQAGFPDK